MTDDVKTNSDTESKSLVANPADVSKIVATIDLSDRANITTFGEGAQRSVTDFADKILSELRNKDAGSTGKLLTEIIEKSKQLDPASLQKTGFLQKLFGSAQAHLERFQSQFETVASQIDRIAIDLDTHKDNLRRDIGVLDDLHGRTREAIVRLDSHIHAGKAFVADYQQNHLPAIKAKGESGDVLAAQEYQDAVQALDRLEKRIHYLQQALQLGIQQLPQIRIVQAGNETLIENLQATASLAIPAWKQKMVIVLGLSRQRDALELQGTVTNATNEMLRQTSAMMKGQAVEIEKQSQRGIVDIETLQQTNQDLIETISGVLAIQKEGRTKRAQAEQEMERMTGELKKALTSQ